MTDIISCNQINHLTTDYMDPSHMTCNGYLDATHYQENFVINKNAKELAKNDFTFSYRIHITPSLKSQKAITQQSDNL